mmetsp:Transcript_2699/g.6330  ORF Transcript_2699/g.6330 Transcript_2699/m.6330 type:complete len:202 (+) Transcript_2699:416-1021(+)|eukprot:CAMPEP_0113640554 /NCGR_PEP_ID=MMETSP0017_2-20120614/21286_1 /TAXON_ID=2856 /ORGANISM="Cylindrotheca closterium" /LENGTH=201 /DNA_ID=CAMNT_0000551845 /DNA_START=349 /DNA_END=954 /DNA_ORIENTATION=- /assembly_acc=CAM_ASM_000147
MTTLQVLAVICSTFLVLTANALSNHQQGFDRRQALAQATAASCATIGILATPPAFAEDATSTPAAFQEGPGGIKYSILKEGAGEKPLRAQKVYTKYTLWTGGFGEDGGKQIDSNTGFMGRPLGVIVGVGQVIKGWDMTLLEMKEGESRRIIVPSDLGYGDKGAGGSIPPKATLYFEMEVTSMDPLPNLNDEQKKWLEEHPV